MPLNRLPRFKKFLLVAMLVLSVSPDLSAADDIFDSVLCRAFGCVLLHNSWDMSLYLMVGAEGAPAIEWQRTRATPIPTVEEGTREVLLPAGAVQSSFLGFDRDGDGLAAARVFFRIRHSGLPRTRRSGSERRQ